MRNDVSLDLLGAHSNCISEGEVDASHLQQSDSHLDNGAAPQLFQLEDEVIEAAVGEDALLPAGIHLQQPLQVSDLCPAWACSWQGQQTRLHLCVLPA